MLGEIDMTCVGAALNAGARDEGLGEGWMKPNAWLMGSSVSR